jgi:ParB/RepB/Spo0J family partition protein
MSRKTIKTSPAPAGAEVSCSPQPALRMEEMWPVTALVDHPDNPRTLNRASPKFVELTASIKANGIYDPLIVRELPTEPEGLQAARDALGVKILQVLSGHRRLAAARACGRGQVPVRNLGVIPEDLAYDIVAMSNLHEDLTPLEEGRRAAIWLDKYHEDAAAVASKLGKTRHWVMTHAQIERGLSADWKAAIKKIDQEDAELSCQQLLARWTAEHWALIARLPLRAQAEQLAKFQKGNEYYGADRWTVADLEDRLQIDVLYVSKAPFPTGPGTKCHACLVRTGVQPLLFGESPEDAAGGKERCLDPKCWAGRVARAVRDEYELARAAALEKANLSGDRVRASVVPVSLAAVPDADWSGDPRRRAYDAKIKPVKKALKGLVESDRITIVKEEAKGAVPGIVAVAGKGAGARQGSLVWVRIAEKPSHRAGSPRPPSPPSPAELAELAKHQAELAKRERWRQVYEQAYRSIATTTPIVGGPPAWQILLCCLITQAWPAGRDHWSRDRKRDKRLAGLVQLAGGGVGGKIQGEELEARILVECWAVFLRQMKEAAARMKRADAERTNLDYDRRNLRDLAPLFAIDLDHEYARLGAKEKHQPVAAATPKTAEGDQAGKKPQAKPRAKPKGRVHAQPNEICDGACGDCVRAVCLRTDDGEPPDDEDEDLDAEVDQDEEDEG